MSLTRLSWLSLTVVACLVSRPGLAEDKPVMIEVDAGREGEPLIPVWSYFGYDEVNYTTTEEGRELLAALTAANRGQVFIRNHFLFNSGDGSPSLKWGSTNLYTEDSRGRPQYDFTTIDAIMDALLDSGALPLFELGFMPQALSSRPEPYEPSGTFVLDAGAFYPPSDYTKWAELVRVWADHVKEKEKGKGRGSQTSWIWELWNEPDIGYWQGTAAEYQTLYDYTEAALHAVIPDAPLAGPAVASPEREFLADFLAHCAEGTNAVRGDVGTRLDLVTFHAKGGVTRVDDHVQMDLANQLRLHQMGFDTIAASAFATTPVVISEADPDGCAACPSTRSRHLDYRNSPAYGAYVVAMMKRSLDLAHESNIDLRGVLTWAFTYPGTPLFAGYRALATGGLDLPVFNALKLLGSLQGERVAVTSDGAVSNAELLQEGVRGAPDVDGLASLDGDTLRVLVWNYHDDLVPAEASPVELTVALPSTFGSEVRVSHQRVDEAHGNAYTAWLRQGSPPTPSSSELELLQRASSALEVDSPHVVNVENGRVKLGFSLPRHGVSLFTLTRASSDGSEGVSGGGCSCNAALRSGGGFAAAVAAACLWALGRRARSRLN